MIKKLIFFFAWIGIFTIAVTGIGYITMPQYFSTIDTSSLIFKVVIFNICLIYMCISILKLLSNFSKEKDYVIKNEHGSVHISTDTVKNLIREILSKDSDIKGLKIECGNRGSKYFVKLNLDMISNNNLSSKTVDIQNLIKTNLEQKLDLKVDYIEVKISRLSPRRDSIE
ncbi:MAG: alkaline shock response membrane anchor protein AmaP [Cetobacterium somerae]|uniref:alkaline shock response membrane anchor protein AmaP n=1 Tax=Cetobacterium TaxID=180162 RepID=UPI000404D723|nr:MULTISPECIES: alkaline shock response membrane anchor protein AmaP [Cetobacterium]MBC2853024.1 alkaline shock response membrane anchor protein AmaP [Cetobacterium sp. 2G large]MCQ9626974.1 alkaline shock response membrane anchor protein AmaP [Cetobacterium somerae]MCX3067513.1 alkaline shock response membrane anchor protein AmaP [Cetobacterium somerae]UPO96930.1 alkaline shock response membrane anchor protein AmaP [Cetobacterium somerae]WVJ01202.1 alkaline shock response membrane anchor pro